MNPRLSPREVDTLAAAAKGLSSTGMAQSLGVTKWTVQTHLSHIFAKLGVDNKMQAVIKAIRLGYLYFDPEVHHAPTFNSPFRKAIVDEAGPVEATARGREKQNGHQS
jgi:DNA-binding CsgD family transcriptional regulator